MRWKQKDIFGWSVMAASTIEVVRRYSDQLRGYSVMSLRTAGLLSGVQTRLVIKRRYPTLLWRSVRIHRAGFHIRADIFAFPFVLQVHYGTLLSPCPVCCRRGAFEAWHQGCPERLIVYSLWGGTTFRLITVLERDLSRNVNTSFDMESRR